MKTLFFILVLSLCSIATVAHAATISFDPEEATVGVNTPFLVGLTLSSAVPVNTVSISVRLPEGVTPVDISDGDSIINFWITPAHFDEASRVLTFEGIIPGGFSGVDGRLLVLTLRATRPGLAQVNIDTASSVLFQNSPSGIQEPLSADTLSLNISPAANAIPNTIPDTDPPEAFVPQVMHEPGIYNDKWLLVFATQDKGSGIDHYEVQESSSYLPFFTTETWHVAQSPYVLRDQNLTSTISVRAIDKDGNVRTETIAAPYPLPWYENPVFSYILIGVLLLLALLFVYRRFAHHNLHA